MRRRGPAPRRTVISGELTIHTAAEHKASLVAAVESAASGTCPGVDVDLSSVTELDTAGLQVLLMAQREAAHLGKTLRITAVSQAVTDVLAIVHLDRRLAVSGPVSVKNHSEESVK